MAAISCTAVIKRTRNSRNKWGGGSGRRPLPAGGLESTGRAGAKFQGGSIGWLDPFLRIYVYINLVAIRVLAGLGDLLAGVNAATILWRPRTQARYRQIHRFGFADFVVAVGTGLTLTLLHDPRMALLRSLPMALIPLFGVGISGATHIFAFDLLRKVPAAKSATTPRWNASVTQ